HELDRLAPVLGLAHELDIGLLAQDRLEAVAEQRVVVAHEDVDLSFRAHVAPHVGRSTSMRVPERRAPVREGRDSMWIRPPRLSMRSRMAVRPKAGPAVLRATSKPIPSSSMIIMITDSLMLPSVIFTF